MVGTWTYDEATNKVVVTGGTSGAPATFADFVTADRAGTATDLLAATAGLSPTLALTYAVRPVEDLAIIVKCIVASKTAEADFIFITGTDWRGAAQTESLDVTAGNGTYTTTKYFATISNIDCSDNAAGGGTQWADGTVQVTQDVWGVIWDYGWRQYLINAVWDIGDGSTTTFFTSETDQVTINPWLEVEVQTAATLRIGEVIDEANAIVTKGSAWMWINNGYGQFSPLLDCNAGTSLIAGSLLSNLRTDQSQPTGYFQVSGSTSKIIRNNVVGFIATIIGGSPLVRDLSFVGHASGQSFAKMSMEASTATLDDIRIGNQSEGIYTYNGHAPTASHVKIDAASVGASINTHSGFTQTLKIIDSVIDWTDMTWGGGNSGTVKEQYTVNINVVDRAGAALQSATVVCDDQGDNEIFSVPTDASGDIAEQTIVASDWTGPAGSSVETRVDPYKFTISKAGYKTLVLDAVDLTDKIIWRLELQSQTAPPRAWRQ